MLSSSKADFFDQKKCRIVAEVAQTHDGSLGQAHAFIDAVADAGADAIKFQTHIAAAESTPQEPFRVAFSRQDANRYDYWKRMEFSREQWKGLADHAHERGLFFLSSPFSVEAVELLDELGVPAWKVGSGEVANPLLLKKMAATGKPILLSSGMSSWAELGETVTFLRKSGAKFAVLQATSKYPTPPEEVGLNVLGEIRARFGCETGLSDHSGTIYPGLAAVTLGAKFLEVHVTLSRYMFGPDVSSSITIDELKQLVSGVRFLETALARPLDKDEEARKFETMRKTFGRSVVPARDLPRGCVLQPGDLSLKKPAIGIGAEKLASLYGKKARRALARDEFFSLEDVEDAE